MFYTERVDGFQITDVTYIGLPPPNTPPTFSIVKWFRHEPPLTGVTVYKDGQVLKNQTIDETSYVVAELVWNRHEHDFDFRSIGTRWLEENPTEDVVKMILDFAKKKDKELSAQEEYW